MRSKALVVSLSLVAGCSANSSLRGFPESEVTVTQVRPELVSGCQTRSGRLVVEVEGALVHEYPNFGAVPKASGQRPMLIVTLESPTPNPADSETAVLLAPAGYQPGGSIDYFRGRRILERPRRYLTRRRLTVRLLENDSTSPPEWLKYINEFKVVAQGGALVGVNVPSAIISDGARLIAQLDPDDLILRYDLDLEPLLAALGTTEDRRALRLTAETPRRAVVPPAPGRPVAQIDLLAYLEPEPGCP